MPAGQAVAVATRCYRHYQAGFLPVAGGIADQPPLLIDCIEVIERAVTDHQQAEQAERESRQRERQPGTPGRGDKALGRFDGPLSGRRGNRPNWRAELKPIE